MNALAVKVGPAEQTPWLPVVNAAVVNEAFCDCPVMAAPPAPAQVPVVVPRWKAYLAALLATASDPRTTSKTSGMTAAVAMTLPRGKVVEAVFRQFPLKL